MEQSLFFRTNVFPTRLSMYDCMCVLVDSVGTYELQGDGLASRDYVILRSFFYISLFLV